MRELIQVAKAAKLVGLKRSELQNMIRCGQLDTFEGKLSVAQLREQFPALSLESSREFERLEHIRHTAFGSRVQSTIAPERGELEDLLKKRSRDLAVERANATKYRAILDDILHQLATMKARSQEQPGQRQLIEELSDWLCSRLND